MEFFPAIAPDYPISKKVGIERTETRLGDGYRSNVRFGFNPRTEEWNPLWKHLSFAEREQIELFLEARAIDGRPFLWVPPYLEEAQQFRIENWSPANSIPLVSRLELVFKRVWEGNGNSPPTPTPGEGG